MDSIKVNNFSKYYSVHKKTEGLMGTFTSFFARKYETVKAVDDVSFTIEEGELVGFIGPNGAGKTTTLKTLSGLLYPTNGQISVLGFKPWERDPEFLKQIALVMGQKNQLWWDLPAIETYTLNKEIYAIPDKEFKTRLDELSQLLDVKDFLSVQVRKLSLGQRMKLELIAALLHAPKVLFLDEPTIGLDVVMQQTIRDFIREYNKKYNATILLTSHYMNDVKELAKRVIVIDHGKIMYDGSLENIIKKFAKFKTVTLTLEKEVPRQTIEKITPVESYHFPVVELQVDRTKISEVTARLLQKLPSADITVEEVSIEEIIRSLFSSRRYDT